MSFTLTLKAKGLFTNPNELSEAPKGGMSVADNVVIDKDEVVETRRGFATLEGKFSNAADRAHNLLEYQDVLIAHYSDDALAYYDANTDAWVDYTGTYLEPDATFGRIRGVSANQNFYFITSAGVQRLDAFDSIPITAGGVKALGGTAVLTGVSGFMNDDTQVAYKIVWGFNDLNNNLVLGVPSERIVVSNSTGGTRDVDIKFTVPDEITTEDFYQIYRTSFSATAASEPNNEYGLVFEDNPTAGEITTGTITITDSTQDNLRGATLYTSTSQEGSGATNEPPPLAKDIATFRDRVFYANTVSPHRLQITLVAVGGSSGVNIGDTITIDGVAYTGAAAEDASADEFQVVTSGTAAQNINDTARSLVRVINNSTTNTRLNGFYLSDFDELPGQILVEEKGVGGAAFSAIFSGSSVAWNPPLPSSGTSISSTNDAFEHYLYFSKSQQPDAVPLTNFFAVGSADRKILRILPLRDALFIFKEDGIFRLTGVDEASFRVDLLDNTVTLLGAETASILNNQIYLLTEQGVATVSDTGVRVISRSIEIDLLELLSEDLDGVIEHSFGVSYESDRKYILFTIERSSDTVATQAYVYNNATSTWTRWTLSKTCGLVRRFDDKLYLGDATSNSVNVERKSRDFTDYVDDEIDVTLLTVNEDQLTFSSIAGMEVGDIIFESSTIFAKIVAIDSETEVITVNRSVGFTPGTIQLLKAIESIVEFLPEVSKNAGSLKQYRELSSLFKTAVFDSLQVGFKSDLSPAREEVSLVGQGIGLWGLIPWGSGQWGGGERAFPLRTYVPLEKQTCSQLTVRIRLKEAFSFFRLNGISYVYNMLSERLRR